MLCWLFLSGALSADVGSVGPFVLLPALHQLDTWTVRMVDYTRRVLLSRHCSLSSSYK